MPNNPISADADARRDVWLSWLLVALILAGCTNLLSQRTVDPDLWGHIQYGEDWIAEGALPRVTSHSYSAVDFPWVNHENLSELALACGHRLGGGIGLMIGKAVLGVAMLLSMIFLAVRKRVHPVLAAVCMLAVTLSVAEFWCARPQMASFMCMCGMLLVFEFAFRDWNEKHCRVHFGTLLLSLPIMVVWTNAHGGFVAGFCVCAAYVGLRAIEAIWRNGKSGLPLAAKLIAVILACGASTMLNPYGPGLMFWLVQSLGQPRPEITEWVSIPSSGTTIIPFTILTVLLLASIRWSTLRRDPAKLITITLVGIQTFIHCRHIVFYGILFGYWIVPHVQSLCYQAQSRVANRPEPTPLSSRQARVFGGIISAATLVLLGSFGLQLARFGVDRDEWPVDALQFMADNNLDGRIVVTFNWAQYVLSAKPNSRVSFDGRFRTCYPQTIVDRNFDFLVGDSPRRFRSEESGPVDPTAILRHDAPDFVLIDRKGDYPATQVMSQQADWTLMFQDSRTQLWARTSKYAVATSPHFITQPKISDDVHNSIAAWPGFPGRTGRDVFVRTAREYVSSEQRNRASEISQQQDANTIRR